MQRSFDVLDKAAANTSGDNNMMNMGLGLSAGMGIGSQVGNMVSQNMNTGAAMPPPLPQASPYFLVISGQQQGPFDANTVATYIQKGLIKEDTLIWKQGMANWEKISVVSEFSQFFGSMPPPIPNNNM